MTEEKETCGAVEKDFQFWMPLDVIKAPGGEMRVGGIATDEESSDIQGEKVFVDGLDISYLKSRGAFNWNHQKGPGDIIGEIDIAQKQAGKLYVEGPLYPHVEQAKYVWNLIRSMKDVKSDRKLGLSIEGKIKERDVANQKLIKKAWIKNVAITYNPINQGTYVDMIKSLGDFQFSPCDGDCKKCSLCECPPEVKKADIPDPLAHAGFDTPGVAVDTRAVGAGADGRVKESDSTDACTKCGKPMVNGYCDICNPPEKGIIEQAICAGHDIPATTGGVSGSALRDEDMEKKKKVTTYTKKDIDKCSEDKKKKKDKMTKAELAEWFMEKGYNVNEAAALAHLIFMSNDMELEKSRVKMHQRVRGGHVEWVKEHERRLSKEDRAYKQTLTDAMQRWHEASVGRNIKQPFAAWLRDADKKTYDKLVAGLPTQAPARPVTPHERERVVRDFAEVLGLPAKRTIRLTKKDYPLGKPDVDSPAQVMHENILARQGFKPLPRKGKTFKMDPMGFDRGRTKKEQQHFEEYGEDIDYTPDPVDVPRKKGLKYYTKEGNWGPGAKGRVGAAWRKLGQGKTFKMEGYDPDVDVKRKIERKHEKFRLDPEAERRTIAATLSGGPSDDDAPGWDPNIGGKGGKKFKMEGTPDAEKPKGPRPIASIAQEIAKDWGGKVNYAAKPYLQAMFSLGSINENYGADTGASVVAYFLSNATSWHGEKAKAIKKELNAMLKASYGKGNR